MSKSLWIGAAALAAISVLGYSQQGAPGQASVTINGKAMALQYAAPSAKGQKVFGGVVPYDKVWSVGGQGMKFHTDADLVFKGAAVPAGDYMLYVLPGADTWKLVIAKPAAGGYNPKAEVGRAFMTIGKSPAALDTCKISLTKTAALAAKLELAWENTVASAPFHLDQVSDHAEW
jgi:hypothetical protein